MFQEDDMSEAKSVGGYEMPKTWDGASDEFKARAGGLAQAIWARVGGLRQVPGEYVRGLAIADRDTFEEAKRLAAQERHDLRLRLIVASLTGHAGRLSDPDTSARLAVELADAVLARLEAEAKVGA